MRKELVIGNWKMNNGPQEAHQFLHDLENLIKGQNIEREFAIAPPMVSIPFMMPHSHGGEAFVLPLASQNFHTEVKGAYTGETSVEFLKELGVKYAILGHSERREYFGETNEDVNKKISMSLSNGLIPVACYGETEKQYEEGKSKDVVKEQLTKMLTGLEGNLENIVLAYEPIWAIGTGKTATAQYAQEIIEYSRQIASEILGQDVSEKIRILYGGSVKPENVNEILNEKDIDGALVGGASVKAESFAKLLK